MSVISEDSENRSAVAAELHRIKAGAGELVRIEQRCKICRDDQVRGIVNKLLGLGLTRPTIVSVLEPFNASREHSEKITYDNIYLHQRRHFDVVRPARAVYDAILKKRAAEGEQDFENGVGAAVNAMSFLETMMVKGYETLIDEETQVSYNDGAKAALQLRELVRVESDGQQAAEVMARQSRIVAAIQEMIPEDRIPELMSRLDGSATASAGIEDADEVDDDDLEVFDPGDDDDEN